MTTIYFGKMPFLDKNYENVIDFSSLSSQISYFKSKLTLKKDSNIKSDNNITSLVLDVNYKDYSLVDYLMFSDGSKWHFYFIDTIEQVTTEKTRFNITIDVWNTYLFNWTMLDSFVDRCHQKRWNNGVPVTNTIDEGFALGEYIQQSVENIYTYNNGMIVTSTSPLGKIDGYVPPSSGGGSTPSGGDWQNGLVSGQGYRFLKGYEGYGVYAYQDAGGYWTICYGITKHGEEGVYNDMVALEPVPEEIGAQRSYTLLQENYGVHIVQACKNMGITQQQQFDALLDLAYNSGYGSITGSNVLTNAIKKNPTDESYIRPIWETYKINPGTANETGLRKRRKAECDIYFNAIYEKRDILKIMANGSYNGSVTENGGNGWLPS